MANRRAVPHLGIYAYGIAAILLGIIGFAWRDFATNWQHVQPGVPYRTALALIAAACEILGGAALFFRRTSRAGAALLSVLFAVFTALWIPDLLRAPLVYDNWGNFFEELSAFLGALTAFAVLAPRGAVLDGTAPLISRIYGICPISFGLDHIIYFAGVVSFVPAWIPPGQRFWAVATTVCFFLAAAAILSGILAGLAARLLTVMIIGFELLLWLPKLIAAPHEHFNWGGNGIGILLAAAAWVVSDVLVASRQPAPVPEQTTVA
jgi:uncharacterized membrane protein